MVTSDPGVNYGKLRTQSILKRIEQNLSNYIKIALKL